MSFDLNKDLVRIVNVNARAEKHGDEAILACDIKCEARMANAVLSKFSPTLKSCLYEKDPGAQEDMINPDHAPKLRNPAMGPINWNLELPNVQFRVHHGESEEDDIVFSDAKANKFSFTCQEGGTVIVGFRVQIHPGEEDAAKLLMLLDKSVKVSMINELGDDDTEGHGEGDSAGAERPDNIVDLFKGTDSTGQQETAGSDGGDPLYDQAVTLVLASRRASISAVQRELRVGYNRAARLLEQMEQNGIVSPMDSDMQRTVIASLPAAGTETEQTDTGTDGEATGEATDPLYQRAVAYVKELNKARPSILVRNLGIEEDRATRMLETMEAEGIVGPAGDNDMRDVLEATAA